MCIRVRKEVDIFLMRPATIPQVTAEVVVIGLLIPATITLVIADNMLVEVDICHKKPATLPLTIG